MILEIVLENNGDERRFLCEAIKFKGFKFLNFLDFFTKFLKFLPL
jgi:hypothetical protein